MHELQWDYSLIPATTRNKASIYTQEDKDTRALSWIRNHDLTVRPIKSHPLDSAATVIGKTSQGILLGNDRKLGGPQIFFKVSDRFLFYRSYRQIKGTLKCYT
jgi:hypothetical protein